MTISQGVLLKSPMHFSPIKGILYTFPLVVL